MLALKFVQFRFFAGVHIRRALIQCGLKFEIVSAVEVSNQRRQFKALFDGQSCDLLPNFNQARTTGPNRIALCRKGAEVVVCCTAARTAGTTGG